MNRIPPVLLLAAAMTVALFIPPGHLLAAVDDKGMIALYELESLTIVYPASPESEREINRISARNRGAFLSAGTGVRVRIVSDAEISGTELKDNLLLLGWDNQLLEKQGLRPPYGRSSVTVRFLDYARQEAGLDLMFRCRSPFSGEETTRDLYFWSRIDQDRDRFMTLPVVGSDWAIFRDYSAIAQGMLVRNGDWPPKRDPIAEKLSDPDIEAYIADRESLGDGPLKVIFNPNRVSREEAAEILTIRTRAHKQVTKALGGSGIGARVDLYVYADQETKEKLTGVKAGAHSVPDAGEMHMTVRFARSSSIHEDVHPASAPILGPTGSTAAYEGLAYALEPVLLNRPLSYYAAVMLDEDRMPAIADLLDEERFRQTPNSSRFATAGLLMTWLREEAGLQKLAAWYSSVDPDPVALAATLGLSPKKLEDRFREWVSARAASHSGDVSFRAAVEQARAHHLNGEYGPAAEALIQALTFKPDDLQTRFTLATTRMKTGAYEEAVADLNKVLEGRSGSAGSLTAHAQLQLGKVYDLLGRREQALAAYRKVLDLPDRHESHLSAREGMATPFTADRLD